MEIQSYLHAITSNIHVNTTSLFVVSTVIIVLAHVVPYLVDPAGLRAYPGPVLAKVSRFWLAWVAYHGYINSSVHNAHEKYGNVQYLLCHPLPVD